MKITLDERDVIEVLAAKVARQAATKLKESIKEFNARRGDTVRLTVTLNVEELTYLLHDDWVTIEHQ